MIDTRSVAMQGIGRAPLHIALQGFVAGSLIDIAGPSRSMRVPGRLIDAQRTRAIDDDDTMLMLAAAVAGAYGALQ